MARRGGPSTAAFAVILSLLFLGLLPSGCPPPVSSVPPKNDPSGRADGGPGKDGPGAGGPAPTRVRYGLAERPANPTCVAPPRPLPAAGATFVPAFPNLTFKEPLLALQPPGDGSRVYVLEQAGRILVFANDASVTAASVFADLNGRVAFSGGETGLLGMAFAPDFATTGEVFLSYTGTVGATLTSFVTRAFSRDGGATLDLTSEQVVLTVDQPARNHNGGHLAFGPDGYLYLGFGDGGGSGDPDGNGQKMSTLLGKMLRIDVKSAQPYAIPPDNPFRRTQRPEIYALGFRNPWRWSFDRATGELWVADVGQGDWEEVDRVVAGGNYGWSIMEGNACFRGAGCRGPGLSLPVVEYGHDEGVAITGGYVYRGTQVPELVGHYVYGDYASGKIWALNTAAPVGGGNPRVLASTAFAISSFGELADGEVLVVDHSGGKLHRLAAAGAPPPSMLATRLSETGCVVQADPTTPAPGMLAYDVNAALWSDGADKTRFLAVPDGTSIELGAEGRFELPPGSVLMKTFSIGDLRVETRLFMRHPDGTWAGYSYEWDDAQTDAVLLEDGKQKAVRGQTWTFPSRAQCMQCHNAPAGSVLGLQVAQLNGDLLYPGNTVANQLETLAHIGVREELPDAPDGLPRLAQPAGSAPLAERARAYLHANCASCHRPGGLGLGAADLRFDVSLEDAGVCNTPPEVDDMGVVGARLLVPGDPARSLLSLRMHDRGPFQMPPLASALVDPDGTALVDDWIRSLPRCPGP